jgi:hypothetical protein
VSKVSKVSKTKSRILYYFEKRAHTYLVNCVAAHVFVALGALFIDNSAHISDLATLLVISVEFVALLQIEGRSRQGIREQEV